MCKALPLQRQCAFYLRLGSNELGIGLAHLRDQRRNQFVHKRLGRTKLVTMTDGATNDPPQDIATTLVRRCHPVSDQECARANVVGNHAQRTVIPLTAAGHFHGRIDQRNEQVGLVIAVHALQHRCQAFQAQAGIHRWPGQRGINTICTAIELHEYQVPDLNVAVTVSLGGARRATGHIRAVIVEDLAARAARPGIAHGPEIVAAINTGETLFGHANLLQPDVGSLVVVLEHRYPEFILGQTIARGEKVPGKLDRLLLKIITKTEIAQHLEEGMMAGGITNVFQVIVLATGAYAALGGDRSLVGPLILPQEHIFELNHTCVGKKQGGVVVWHQRAGRNYLMAVARKIIQKLLPDILGLH